MVLPNYRKHVHAWSGCRPKHFDDLALRIYMARLPFIEAHHDFVPDCAHWLASSHHRAPGSTVGTDIRPNVNVVREAGIIRHDIVKVPGSLQRPNHGVVSTLENSNDAAFGTPFYPS